MRRGRCRGLRWPGAGGGGLAITGTTTIISAVAVPNIANAVQNSGSGGGGSGDSGAPQAPAGEPSLDEQAQSLVDEHLDSNGGPSLTLENAYKALVGAPDGTRLRVMPKENMVKDDPTMSNPDIEILDRSGNIVGYREVKSMKVNNQKRFGKDLSDAVNQDMKRGAEINQVFIQVPKGSDASFRGFPRSGRGPGRSQPRAGRSSPRALRPLSCTPGCTSSALKPSCTSHLTL